MVSALQGGPPEVARTWVGCVEDIELVPARLGCSILISMFLSMEAKQAIV